MRRHFLRLTLALLIVLGGATGVWADPDPNSLPRVPIGGDQDGSEVPFLFKAPGFDLLPDVQTFRIPGAGAVEIVFDFVFREASYNNEFGFFSVDNPSGAVDGLNPGEPGYLAAAFARAMVVFPSGSTAYTPDVTVTVEGGEMLGFFIVQNSRLVNLLASNPDNRIDRSPLAFFSLDALNPDGIDHFVGFRNLAQDITQFGFEDLTGGGDLDYDDIVYNIGVALRPSPLSEARDIVFVRGLNSEGRCDGANQWVPSYLASDQGQSYFSGVEVGQYLNFNYAGGGSYECTDPAASPVYSKIDTCDGVAKAADELAALISELATAKVTILAHSMGGLVSAYLVASSDAAWVQEHIASVVTFDSPLKGVPEAALNAFSLISECNSGDSSMEELAETSSIVFMTAPAATKAAIYPLDATTRVDPTNFVITRERTRLDSARHFHWFSACSNPWGPSEPDCEPPRSTNDNHSQSWSRRFDGDNTDKGLLVGCAVVNAFDCTFLSAFIPAGGVSQELAEPAQSPVDAASTQTGVEVVEGTTRVRFSSAFAEALVGMTLRSPSGTNYGPDGAGPVAAYAAGDTFEIYEITDPAPGTWTVEFTASGAPPTGVEVGLAVLVQERTPNEINVSPLAHAGGPYAARLNEQIRFSAVGSFDADGLITLYEWDFDNDGIMDLQSIEPTTVYSYAAEFSGSVRLRVTDDEGAVAESIASVVVSPWRTYLPLIAIR